MALGLSLGFGLGARGVATALLAPAAAPTLTLTTGATDNTPGFQLDGALVELDTVRFQYSTSAVFATASEITNAIDAAEDDANQLIFSTGALADGTWYFRARIERPGHANSAWSNTETETIDTTAPTLSSPAGASTGQTTASLSVSTNEGNGTVYWVVDTNTSTPSKAQVKAGQDQGGNAADDSGSQAVVATGAQPISGGATGLTGSTGYKDFYMQEDAVGNQSNVSAGAGFTTDAGAGGFALVAHAVAASLIAPSTSAIDTTGADLLVVSVSQYAGFTIATLTDSKGNTWTPLTAKAAGGGNAYNRIFYCASPVVGSGHTFTFANGVSSVAGAIAVQAWSGAHASPFNAENGATTNGATSLQTGSVTPSQDNCLVVASAAPTNDSTNYTINGGFTESDEADYSTGVNEGLIMAYLVQTSAAAANPTISWTTSAEAAATIAVFKGA